jgi:hypothetical protein
MTRSTHSKSRKPRNQKQISQKRGTRKLQRGGVLSMNPLDWFRSSSSTTGDSTNPQSKDEALKQKLTTTLKELTNLLPQVKICAKESEMANEEARKADEEARKAQADDVARKTQAEEAAAVQPMMGGSKSRRRGRGRAPPKGGPKGKKGMMVGPRKGPIIF